MKTPSTLTIDVGNTYTKYTVFTGESGRTVAVTDTVSETDVASLYSDYDIGRTLISSVNLPQYSTITDILKRLGIDFLHLNRQTPLPFGLCYQTPETLGFDRIAAAAGAICLCPDKPVLIIDVGTCITYDFCANRQFLGGNIAPGIAMRIKAMHAFTAALPDTETDYSVDPMGKSTSTAMQAGAFWGAVYEMESYITRYSREYSALQTIITGGGAERVMPHLNTDSIRFEPLLVPIGLNFIANNLSNEYKNSK